MDSIESQLTDASKDYKIYGDKNYVRWVSIAYLQNKFFILHRKKEEAMRWYGQHGNLVMSRHITISNALMEEKKLEKMNIAPSTLEEGEEFLVEI